MRRGRGRRGESPDPAKLAKSVVVGALSVGREIEPFALLILGDPQTKYEFCDIEGYECANRCPCDSNGRGGELDAQLASDGITSFTRAP